MARETNTGAQPRVLAARAVSAVIDQRRSLDAALADWPIDLVGADLALARMLAYGTLREHRRLGALLAPRLKKAPQPLLAALLHVGIFQLEATRVPAHAAVHATVAATKALGLGGARGMVNAVLRGHQRAPATIAVDDAALVHSYPDWLAEHIAADWATDAPAVLAAGNDRAAMQLRVNSRRATREALLAEYAEAGIEATAMPACRDGICLDEPMAADKLPGFVEGRVSIQDGAAQLAADLVAPRDGDRVLDACAAPGNKSAHLLERADIALTALDIDETRLAILEGTLARLGLSADSRVGDAAEPRLWWDSACYDRILLDAPCSGTGVIRRHPDIKWLRRASDIDAARARQAALLAALWPTLAPGGRLVYATCSILAAEGDAVIDAFIAVTPEAAVVPIEAEWGRASAYGRRIAPGDQGFDGFYYAVLEKKTGSP